MANLVREESTKELPKGDEKSMVETMDYFKSQIKEEMEGARGYAEKALLMKRDDPKWARIFIDMSRAELGHARNLYMMMDSCESITRDSAYATFAEWYSDELSKVKGLHALVLN